jgi:hypothetical protein
MTRPLPGSGHATRADPRGCCSAATTATRPPSLTSPVAGSDSTRQDAGNRVSGLLGHALAATATGTHVHLGVVVLLAAAGVAVWLVRAWLWPFAPCRWCRGRKTNPGSTRMRFSTCRHCGGSGTPGTRLQTVHRTVLGIRTTIREDKEDT